MWLVVCALLAVLFLLYKNLTDKYTYWKDRGFPYLEPKFPLGNFQEWHLRKQYQGYIFQEIYRQAADKQCVGVLDFNRPTLFVTDPEFIKDILVRDFASFRDRTQRKMHEKVGEHLFILAGDRWRQLRIKLSPTFTSGKLKTMFRFFQGCSIQLDQMLEEKAKQNEIIDVKELMFLFTSDIIATCAFGLEINAMKNPNNEICKLFKSIIIPSLTLGTLLKLFLLTSFPAIGKLLRITFIPKETDDKVYNLVRETVEYREKTGMRRGDFLDLLIDLKNNGKLKDDGIEMYGEVTNKGSLDGKTKTTSTETDKGNIKEEIIVSNGTTGVEDVSNPLEMTMELLAAQCFVFLIAGFETSSSVMSYCMYELALNQQIQDRLRNEIDTVISKNDGVTFEALKEMEFLDQVVMETMRKYPTLSHLTRTCTKNYRIPKTNMVLEEGTRLLIPTYALHHDPQYFPEPEKFDPDRFSPEGKLSMVPFTYLPFGEGPRFCIGKRFGLLQTKMGLCTILYKYKLLLSEASVVPLQLAPSPLISVPKTPIKLKIVLRE